MNATKTYLGTITKFKLQWLQQNEKLSANMLPIERYFLEPKATNSLQTCILRGNAKTRHLTANVFEGTGDKETYFSPLDFCGKEALKK